MVQHVFGTTGIQSFQRRAGPRPARHEQRLASAGGTGLPVIPGMPGGSAPPPQQGEQEGGAGVARATGYDLA
eukprot:gene16444-biopygen21794